MDNAQTGSVQVAGLAHIGVRVHDLDRSMRFYELLGFTKTAGPIGPEPVAILDHPSGVELNLWNSISCSMRRAQALRIS